MHTAIFPGVPYIFDQFGLTLPRTFYQNSRSLSYQHVANLLHLDVSFLDYLAVMLQLILLKILLLELSFFLSQNCLPPEYVTLVLGWNPWFLLFILGLLFYCFSLYFWTLRAFWLTRFLNLLRLHNSILILFRCHILKQLSQFVIKSMYLLYLL